MAGVYARRPQMAAEMSASVFEKYRIATYREASYKAFVIAAMILMARVKAFAGVLKRLAKD